MSHNITHVTCVALRATMRAVDVDEFLDEPELPELNFLLAVGKEARLKLRAGQPAAPIALVNFWWSGGRSGELYGSLLLKKICPKIRGRVEAVFDWDDGKRSGLIVEDRLITHCRVEMTLVPIVDKKET